MQETQPRSPYEWRAYLMELRRIRYASRHTADTHYEKAKQYSSYVTGSSLVAGVVGVLGLTPTVSAFLSSGAPPGFLILLSKRAKIGLAVSGTAIAFAKFGVPILKEESAKSWEAGKKWESLYEDCANLRAKVIAVSDGSFDINTYTNTYENITKRKEECNNLITDNCYYDRARQKLNADLWEEKDEAIDLEFVNSKK